MIYATMRHKLYSKYKRNSQDVKAVAYRSREHLYEHKHVSFIRIKDHKNVFITDDPDFFNKEEKISRTMFYDFTISENSVWFNYDILVALINDPAIYIPPHTVAKIYALPLSRQ
jgi:hypothetical protein